MSALDQVFIKAFEKETSGADAASQNLPAISLPASAPQATGETTAVTGAWRRIDRAGRSEHGSAVPSPHAAFAREESNVVPRRMEHNPVAASATASTPAPSPNTPGSRSAASLLETTMQPRAASDDSSSRNITAFDTLAKYPLVSVPASSRTKDDPTPRNAEATDHEDNDGNTDASENDAEQVSGDQSQGSALMSWKVVVSDLMAADGDNSSAAPAVEYVDWTEIALALAAISPTPVESYAPPADEAPASYASADHQSELPHDTVTAIDGAETEINAGEAPSLAITRDEEDSQPANYQVADVPAPEGISESHHDGDDITAPFAAEWEVDRLQWPEICRQLLQNDHEYFQAAGRRLRDAADDGLHVLAVTAAGRGEGQTSLALCLAKCAAGAEMRVAVIDADVDNPQIALRLGLGVTYGWEDFVQRNAPLAECAVVAVEDHITVIPIADAQRARENEAGLLGMLKRAGECFDLVIVDLGSLGGCGERMLQTSDKPAIDAAIVVCDLRSADRTPSQRAVQRLKDAGIEAVGIAENFAAPATGAKAA